MDRDDLVYPPGIGPGKDKTGFKPSSLSIYQGRSDTVRTIAVIAGLETVIDTLIRLLFAGLYLFDESTPDGSTGKSYRTLYNGEVFLGGPDIGFLESRGSVALVGGHEAGAIWTPAAPSLLM